MEEGPFAQFAADSRSPFGGDELEAEFARRFDAGHIRWDQHDMPIQASR